MLLKTWIKDDEYGFFGLFYENDESATEAVSFVILIIRMKNIWVIPKQEGQFSENTISSSMFEKTYFIFKKLRMLFLFLSLLWNMFIFNFVLVSKKSKAISDIFDMKEGIEKTNKFKKSINFLVLRSNNLTSNLLSSLQT